MTDLEQPRYVKRAKIHDSERIKSLPLSVGEIALHAEAHINTVSGKMAGSAGQFLKVHQVFTAVSMASGNAFKRSDHVLFQDSSDNQFKADPVLDECRVFVGLNKVLHHLKLTEKNAGDLAGVQTHYVKNMIKGLPVRKEFVNAVFSALSAQIDIDYDSCVFL